MSQTASEHRADAPRVLRCAVVTVSDTRTPETDTGGQEIVARLASAGHEISDRRLLKDDPDEVRQAIVELMGRAAVDAVLVTGGTGISARDRTCEAIAELFSKPLPGYGELFRWLSYQEIGPAAMLSRAIGGLCGQTVVLTMPGSPAAVRLAMDKLILPELPHLVREARR
jgi:molybdenum cofactor biosynthesis protein B